MLRKILGGLIPFWFLLVSNAAVAAEAVVLMYHRFGEESHPSTNIRLEQFETHLRELTNGSYRILPLPEIAAALKNGGTLPPHALAITIDDAYASVYREAWPRLRAAGIPFTLFVSTEALEEALPDYLSWDQVREMAKAGVTIGHHAHSHRSLIELSHEEALADIKRASERFATELGAVPEIFAYPYGEFDAKLAVALDDLGFIAAFGQHSGVASSYEPLLAQPRFALNENHAGQKRFRLIANARALPVRGVVPADPRLGANPPPFGFTVADKVRGLAALGCFPSHMEEAAKVQILGGERVEVRFEKPFPRGRSRINCTMPDPEGRWYWFGRPFFVD